MTKLTTKQLNRLYRYFADQSIMNAEKGGISLMLANHYILLMQAGTILNYRAVMELCKRATVKHKPYHVTREVKRGEHYIMLESLSFTRRSDADDMLHRLVGVSLSHKPLTTVVEIDTQDAVEYRVSTVEVKDLLIIKLWREAK